MMSIQDILAPVWQRREEARQAMIGAFAGNAGAAKIGLAIDLFAEAVGLHAVMESHLRGLQRTHAAELEEAVPEVRPTKRAGGARRVTGTSSSGTRGRVLERRIVGLLESGPEDGMPLRALWAPIEKAAPDARYQEFLNALWRLRDAKTIRSNGLRALQARWLMAPTRKKGGRKASAPAAPEAAPGATSTAS